MTDTDYGILTKLNRAMAHLKALDRTIKRYLKSSANGVINDFTSEPDYLVVRGRSKWPPPPSCRVLIGEFLYNARAALDYSACELAKFNGQSVDDNVEFPIFLLERDYRNSVTGKLQPAIVKRIGLLHPMHQARIEEEQPFKGRDGKPEEDPLWLLYTLSNYDRHQFIHLTSVVTNASFHTFTPSEASARFRSIRTTYGPFENNAEIARFLILPGPEVDVHVQSDVRFDVAFGEGGPGAGRQVLRTLGGIGARVAETIKRIGESGVWSAGS